MFIQHKCYLLEVVFILDDNNQLKIKTLTNTGFIRVFCGDAENRTRVQTSSSKAFYILSSFLVFD
ncbi:protein of unknown function [Tenacibaculum aestuariivivum]